MQKWNLRRYGLPSGTQQEGRRWSIGSPESQSPVVKEVSNDQQTREQDSEQGVTEQQFELIDVERSTEERPELSRSVLMLTSSQALSKSVNMAGSSQVLLKSMNMLASSCFLANSSVANSVASMISLHRRITERRLGNSMNGSGNLPSDAMDDAWYGNWSFRGLTGMSSILSMRPNAPTSEPAQDIVMNVVEEKAGMLDEEEEIWIQAWPKLSYKRSDDERDEDEVPAELLIEIPTTLHR